MRFILKNTISSASSTWFHRKYLHLQWDGSDLVVTTNSINWGYFDTVGISSSDAIETLERFSPSADGARLDCTMTVTDPATFTEPVTVSKHWIWSPEVQVEPFECVADE